MIDKTEEAVSLIRTRILTGAYRPGERLSESRIAHDIGFPIMPVRFAIAQLEFESLVSVEPRKGTYVHSPVRGEIVELIQSRLAIELAVVKELKNNLAKIDLGVVRKLNHKMEKIARQKDAGVQDFQEFAALDGKFHVTLAEAAGFPSTLAQFLHEIWLRLRLVTLPENRMDALLTSKEHRVMLHCFAQIRMGRTCVPSPEDAVREHLKNSVRRWQAKPGFDNLLLGLLENELNPLFGDAISG